MYDRLLPFLLCVAVLATAVLLPACKPADETSDVAVPEATRLDLRRSIEARLEALDVETAEIRARLPRPEVEETLDRVDERRVALVDLMEELREPADAETFRDLQRSAAAELDEMALLLAEARLASRTEPAAFDAALDAQVAALADSISASTSADVQERAAAFGALRDRLHEAEGDAWAERKADVVEAWIALRRALAEAAVRRR